MSMEILCPCGQGAEEDRPCGCGCAILLCDLCQGCQDGAAHQLTEAQARVLHQLCGWTSRITVGIKDAATLSDLYNLGLAERALGSSVKYHCTRATPAGRAALDEYERAESQGSRSIKAK